MHDIALLNKLHILVAVYFPTNMLACIISYGSEYKMANLFINSFDVTSILCLIH